MENDSNKSGKSDLTSGGSGSYSLGQQWFWVGAL